MADDLRYTGTVRGAEAVYPRGGRWTLTIFMVICSVFIAWWTDVYWPVVAIWALVVASAWANVWKLTRRGYPLFQATDRGIVFATQQVPWKHVEELRISATRGGALLEIVLTPSAPIAHRSLLRQAADLPLGSFWLPGRRRYVPALALPRRNPPRYVIPLLQVSQAELRSELARLLPGIPIVMIWTKTRGPVMAPDAGGSHR